MSTKYETEADLTVLANLADNQIDKTDIPELSEDFWENAEVKLPVGKKQLTVRFDQDVVEWFKTSGKGYQTRMNAVLRSYMEAQK
ncbi:MAG: BrnA antitoxin family protein [Pseudomonadota bacterium]